ncbi:MAG: amino acid ABC transporter permease, partial [Janthinobacterium lividum]
MAYHFDFSSVNADNMRVLGEGMLLSLEITGTAILVGIVWGTLLAMMRLSGIKPLQW